jgi:hypothetical protein
MKLKPITAILIAAVLIAFMICLTIEAIKNKPTDPCAQRIEAAITSVMNSNDIQATTKEVLKTCPDK